MSEIRLNFLNWRPDQEASQHDGLTVAENVIHDAEGYKQVLFATAGAVSTAISMSTTTSAVLSAQVRQAGSKRDASTDNKVHCLIINSTAVGRAEIWVGSGTDLTTLFAQATLTASAGTVSPVASAAAITAFEVCELEGNVFITAEAKAENSSGEEMTGRVTAYMPISIS